MRHFCVNFKHCGGENKGEECCWPFNVKQCFVIKFNFDFEYWEGWVFKKEVNIENTKTDEHISKENVRDRDCYSLISSFPAVTRFSVTLRPSKKEKLNYSWPTFEFSNAKKRKKERKKICKVKFFFRKWIWIFTIVECTFFSEK